jgi:uncharacterized membrane protein
MSLVWGAVFGFASYGTYAFTCLAIFNNWPVSIAVMEVCWGIFVCGITSYITTLFYK